MASRGSIPKVMELAGIDMLPPEAGVPLIRRELTAGGTRGEIVIAQRLGLLQKEWDSTGGLDTTPEEVEVGALPVEGRLHAAPFADTSPQGPMIGRISGVGLHGGLTIETTLDPSIQPFLQDHQIDGTPVLPGVMGIEAFAEAALWMLPGWHVDAVEDVNFLAAFKFYRNAPRTATIHAVIHPQGDSLVADCCLVGQRRLPNQAEAQVTTHFTGRVRLTKQPPQGAIGQAPSAPARPVIEAADIYRVYFHGPAYQVVQRAWRDEGRMVGEMAQGLTCHHHPSERPTLLSPRLIELCFQTAGLWEMGLQGRMGLPQRVRQVCLCRAPELAEGQLYAVVTPADPDQGSFDAEVRDAEGNLYLHLSGYRTVALPNGLDAELLKPLQAAVSFEAVPA